MDGVLLVDKPAGPTSHDVVARVRRAIGQSGIGHAGTLDPAATGLLVLVVGRATKLASLLTGHRKTYDAAIRLGFGTTTDDAEGTPIGEVATSIPDDAAVAAALEQFRGTFSQMPPAFSAKKVGGRRAHAQARRDKPLALKAVDVTVHDLRVIGREAEIVHLHVSASAGFYVRALARDLGRVLGCGAHLCGLRRTASGVFDVRDATPLEEVERLGPAAGARLLSPGDALPDLAAVSVTENGLRRALHGNFLNPDHMSRPAAPGLGLDDPVKILAPDGRLIALARARGGALHPVVVLG
jgi:tRNA pseudouridine55 synthase